MDHVRVSRVLGTGIAAIEAALEEIMSNRVVRAKFWLVSKKEQVNSTEVELSAVCRGEDNKKWASATPVGKITMTVLTEACADWHAGDEFFVDFTPAPKGQEGMGD